METVRAHQVAGNAPWEMKSFFAPQQCVSREQRIKTNEERQNEKGREECVMRAEVTEGMFSLCCSCESLLIHSFYLENEPTDVSTMQ